MAKKLFLIIILFAITFATYALHIDANGSMYVSSGEEIEIEIPIPPNSALCGVQIHNRTADVIKFKWSMGRESETVVLNKDRTLLIDLIKPITKERNLYIENIDQLMVIKVTAKYKSL